MVNRIGDINYDRMINKTEKGTRKQQQKRRRRK